MNGIRPILLAIVLGTLHGGCGELERSNPYHIRAQEDEEPTASLALRIPMAKALAIVVSRVEAVLAGPGSPTITKELDISPLGPATGFIGTSAPGPGFSLTLRGYDTDGELLFEGSMENITIVEGDTTLVEVDLFLTREIPGLGDPPEDGGGTDAGADAGTDTGTDATTDTGTDTTADADAGADADTGTDTGTEADPDATTDTATDTEASEAGG